MHERSSGQMGRGSGRVLDDYVTWQSGGTPSKANQRYWAGNIPWVTPKDMKWFDLKATTDYLTPAGVAAGSRVAPQNVTYIVVRGMILAHTFPVSQMSAPAAFNQDVKAVHPGPELIPRYLAYWFKAHADDFLRLVGESTHGTKKLDLPDLRIFPMDPPNLAEQARIVEILNTLDAQIRLTESTASKLRATFVGLLSRLLTQGMQSSTAPLGSATLEFGETSITLPKQWTIEPIGHLLGPVDPAMRSGPFGSALLKHELVDAGVPLLGIDNVHVDRFVSDFQRFVTPAKAAELSRYRVRPADVMITIMGTVGRSCLVPKDIGHALSSKHVWTLTFDDARYRPYLASLQLNHAPWARAHLRRDEQGGIMNAIRSDTLRTLMLPTPPIDEQLEIEAILKTLESEIASQEHSLIKLRALEAGLMEDLLTGRVRIPEMAVS